MSVFLAALVGGGERMPDVRENVWFGFDGEHLADPAALTANQTR